MSDLIRWAVRNAAVAVLWVFILSITVNDRSLFAHANRFLVQNRVVAMVDEGLGELWTRVYETARATLQDLSGTEERRI